MQKTLMSVLLAGLSSIALLAQQPQPANPAPKMIQVTGSAEMEIEPDEAYLSINLREYQDKSRHSLDEIDKSFKKALDELKIDMKNVSLESVQGYYDWDYWRNKQTDFFASKTYIVKLPDLSKYNALMEKLNMKGVQHVYLQKTDHSRIEEYRKKIKIDALKAAKDKAGLMLQGIGEQLGEVIFVRENDQNYYPMYKNNMMANMAMDGGSAERSGGGEMNAGLQKIRLRYEVEAHFKIK